MNSYITIGNKKIGKGYPTYIVAELSANHHQSYEEAVKLLKAAKDSGADAVKLQTYTPDTMTINSDKEYFRVGGEGNPELWKNKTLYQLYEDAYTPWDWQPKLKKIANEIGIELFSTPFDSSAVDFLEKMDVPCYKIASYEINDIPLLKKVANTGKPLIISTGYALLDEIELAVDTLRKNGANEIAILHCVTSYSEKSNYSNLHLATINDIAKRFNVVAGFSENSGGIDSPIFAVATGASIIEKHFILKRSDGGPDAKFSIEPNEMKKMISEIRQMENILGDAHYGPIDKNEEYNKRFRRSLFVVKDIKKGEILTFDNVRSIRPAYGLHTKFLDEILGKRANTDIQRGTPLNWNLISE